MAICGSIGWRLHNGLPSPDQIAPAVGRPAAGKEALWAIQRTLGRCVLCSLRVAEVQIGLTHWLEVETSAGAAITPALPLWCCTALVGSY